MTNKIELEENAKLFLMDFFNRTKGDLSARISMYDIGTALGMDKITASHTAEILIGWQLAEVRTLSGGIGITVDGVNLAEELGGKKNNAEQRLSNALVMTEADIQIVEDLAAEIKTRAGNLGLDFDTLNELTVDLKTINVQLTSSKPKTAIIRECLRSICSVLKKTGGDIFNKIKVLLNE